MKIDDAFRKIRLLKRIVPANGASEAEADTAAKLAAALMNRFSITDEAARHVVTAPTRLTWVYWELLLREFSIELSRFGRRGTAPLGSGQRVFIRLDTGQWWVKKKSSNGWKTIARDSGVESLRAFLIDNGPCSFSVAAI